MAEFLSTITTPTPRSVVVWVLLAIVMNVPVDEARLGVHTWRLVLGARQANDIAGVRVVGQPTLVFDHLTDQREPNHLADFATTAWKEADGTVNLTVSHFENYRMRGPDLEHLTSARDVIFSSTSAASDPVEAHVNNRHWLAAPYTFDGRTVFALAHHEWYACLSVGDCEEGGPPTTTSMGSYQLNSWANALTLLMSQDGGASWRVNGAPGTHLVANERFNWTGSAALEKGVYRQGFNHTGLMTPSRLIKEGTHYYSIAFVVHRDFANLSPATGQAPADKEGWVLIRTTDPTRSSGWEGWESGDQYVALDSRRSTAFNPMPMAGPPQIIYDTNAEMYIAVFAPFGRVGPAYYVTTPTLAKPSWSAPVAIEGTADLQINPRAENPGSTCSIGFQPGNYLSVIDSHSRGLNFESTDGDPWLFYSYNPALGCLGDNMARDIFRVRLSVVYR